MAITDQLYVPDRGSVTINTVEQNGSVKTMSYSAPRRTERIVNSLGGRKTEMQTRQKAGNYEASLVVYDDASLADDAAAVLTTLWTAYETGIELTDMVVIPAGSTTGMLGYTFGGSIHVAQCAPHADLDADTEDEGTVTAIVITETIVAAAIA